MEFYTTGDAARFLGVSQSTIGNYIKRGLLVPDLVLPSYNGKSGRQKFTQETLLSFKEKLNSGSLNK